MLCAIKVEQPNSITASTCITIGTAANCQKPSYAQYDVYVALVQYTLRTLFVYDILNINNVYFDSMLSHIYPSELQLNKANTSDTEAAFLDLHLSISNDCVTTKFYDIVTTCRFPIFGWGCSSLYTLWSLYLSNHLFC